MNRKALGIGLLIVLFLVVWAVAVANAAGREPEVLQPYWILRVGDTDVGYVYAVDYGWLAVNESGSMVYFCGCDEQECYTPPTLEPTKKPPTSVPTLEPTPEPKKVFCHCEQGEGKGAEGRKNCHDAKYTNGHAKHAWDYWDDAAPYCDGWHH